MLFTSILVSNSSLQSPVVDTDTQRRVRSGPSQRATPTPPVEERGEGDGKEMPHRAPSSAGVRNSPPRRYDS